MFNAVAKVTNNGMCDVTPLSRTRKSHVLDFEIFINIVEMVFDSTKIKKWFVTANGANLRASDVFEKEF